MRSDPEIAAYCGGRPSESPRPNPDPCGKSRREFSFDAETNCCRRLHAYCSSILWRNAYSNNRLYAGVWEDSFRHDHRFRNRLESIRASRAVLVSEPEVVALNKVVASRQRYSSGEDQSTWDRLAYFEDTVPIVDGIQEG